MKKFFRDIFWKHILLVVAIIALIYCEFQEDGYFIPRYLLLLFMVGTSVSYCALSYIHKLDRKKDVNKLSLIIRSVIIRFSLIVIYAWIDILLNSFGIKLDDSFSELVKLLIAYSQVFSLLAIMLGVKLRTLFIITVVTFPILTVLGVFDIKWWALITGFLALWNYINSEEFLYYLRKGKKLNRVPQELIYKWSVNKLVGYLITFLFYLSLVISSFFEIKEPHNITQYLENAQKRILSLLGVVAVLCILVGILYYYYYLVNKNKSQNLFHKVILKLGDKIGLKYFNKTIQFYVKAKKGELT